jgi:hypothetical protein
LWNKFLNMKKVVSKDMVGLGTYLYSAGTWPDEDIRQLPGATVLGIPTVSDLVIINCLEQQISILSTDIYFIIPSSSNAMGLYQL